MSFTKQLEEINKQKGENSLYLRTQTKELLQYSVFDVKVNKKLSAVNRVFR